MARTILPFAEHEGIAVIACSPMGSGLLTGAIHAFRPVSGSVPDAQAGSPAIIVDGDGPWPPASDHEDGEEHCGHEAEAGPA